MALAKTYPERLVPQYGFVCLSTSEYQFSTCSCIWPLQDLIYIQLMPCSHLNYSCRTAAVRGPYGGCMAFVWLPWFHVYL